MYRYPDCAHRNTISRNRVTKIFAKGTYISMKYLTNRVKIHEILDAIPNVWLFPVK